MTLTTTICHEAAHTVSGEAMSEKFEKDREKVREEKEEREREKKVGEEKEDREVYEKDHLGRPSRKEGWNGRVNKSC